LISSLKRKPSKYETRLIKKAPQILLKNLKAVVEGGGSAVKTTVRQEIKNAHSYVYSMWRFIALFKDGHRSNNLQISFV
jgi:hypothetical protein